MRKLGAIVILAGMLVGTASAKERALKSRISSVGLFKNGLAVIRRRVIIPAPGTYRVENVPEPVHGTFWVESDAKIITRLSKRVIEVPEQISGSANFQEQLAGKEVVIHFADGRIPPARGKVVAIEPAKGEGVWNRSYRQPSYYYYGNQNRQPSPGAFLILQTAEGRSYISSSSIAYLQAKGATGKVKRRVPVLLFSVSAMKRKTAIIEITYLARGMAWAPSYRVDISDPKSLFLQQKAVIKNELEELKDGEIQLISGFPSVKFAHVTSPMSLRTNWTTFFTQLNQRFRPGHASMMNVVGQQAIAYNAPAPAGGLDLSATPSGEGVDLHYESIGKQTLGEGESLTLTVASAKAAYDRIVEWIVPDTREANGHYVDRHAQNQDPEKYRDAAWDAVRFKNPFAFPMTTGPAVIVAKKRFNGQCLSYWVNSGEQTTLHITKALSLRIRSVEQEVAGTRQEVIIGGSRYRKTTVQGELRANNHRKEAISLVIRRRFSGELLQADKSPKRILLEEGVYSVNKRNQLTWELSLKPGREIKLSYSYTVLVRR